MVAAAIEGDRGALNSVLDGMRFDEWVGHHRMGPALFVAAHELGIQGPAVDRCQEAYVATAAQWLRLRAVLSRIGGALDAEDVPWIPLKGLDTAERFFSRPELRPTSDLDVLVPAEQLECAMQALEGSDWAFPSTPLMERYQREEGYNWHGQAFHGESLELHYRLWGTVPDSVVEGCWRWAVLSPDLGRRGFRLEPAMAFLVCAVHSWIHAGQPQFIYWWELKLIADRLAGAGDVVAFAREHGLQFPVGLVAEYVGQLWQHELCLGLARELLEDIRLPERVVLRRVRRRGIESMTLEMLYVARLLARRPSRMGWKSVLRRVWPHAGIVEDTTSKEMAWWRRRVMATANSLGLGR